MRAIINDQLWIGNALDVRDVTKVLSLGVRAIVDLAANEPLVMYPRDIAYCRVPLNDGLGNEPAFLRTVIQITSEFIAARVPTFVACSAGMSRSPAIVAAALAWLENAVPDELLLRVVTDAPHDVSPALWGDVKQSLASLRERRS